MQKLQVLWTENAAYDLQLIIGYIKLDSIETAKRIFYEIRKKCDNLSIFPESQRIVPELQQIGISKYREIIYKRWRIIYKIEMDKVYILIVVDTSRNVEDILFQRLLRDK